MQSRRGAYDNYISRLKAYVSARDSGLTTQHLVEGLKAVGHITVWREMQRQWDKHDELREIFGEDKAPEALLW